MCLGGITNDFIGRFSGELKGERQNIKAHLLAPFAFPFFAFSVVPPAKTDGKSIIRLCAAVAKRRYVAHMRGFNFALTFIVSPSDTKMLSHECKMFRRTKPTISITLLIIAGWQH